MAQEAGDFDTPGQSKDLWQRIRWSFPRTRSKSRHQPLLIESLDAQWSPHFAKLEAGEPYSDTALFSCCVQRQETKDVSAQIELKDLPSRWDIERALLTLKNNKASGPDGLPCELFKGAAAVLSAPLMDLYAKVATWQCEPIQSKGGLMMPVFKKGDPGVASSYRGIMLINVISKIFHRWLRQQLMLKIEDIRQDTHLGGFSGQQAVFGAHCLQVFARVARAQQLPAAALFVDVQGAYHFLIRELVMGSISGEDEALIVDNLKAWQADTRGVQLWLRTPPVLQRLRLPQRLISLLREIHVDTWSKLPHLPGRLRSARGSRPGSPLADAIYSALMIDVHSEMYRILEEHEGVAQAFQKLEVKPFAVTWADDLAIPIVAENNEDLLAFAAVIARKVYVAFERRGLLLNMAPWKTALVPAFRGPEAPDYRRRYLLTQEAGIDAKVDDTRTLRLRFACSYKHLGMMFTPNGEVDFEVRCRLGQARTALQDLGPVLFRNKHITIQTRLRLFESLIISRLCYGISAWGQLSPKLLKTVDSFILRAQRRICGYPPSRGPTNDEMISRYKLPLLAQRLAVARLSYAAKLWQVGPGTLQSLLETDWSTSQTSWWHHLLADLRWCQQLAGVAQSRSFHSRA